MKLEIISATWCSSCLIMNKHIKKIQKDFPTISITKTDYDIDEERVAKLSIGDILPVIIVYNQNNTEMTRIVGEKSYNELINIMNKYKEE